jgi:inner membrane protein
MQIKLALKIASILLLSLLLWVPLAMIGDLVAERQQLRNNVVTSIARESVGGQRLSGPVLRVPYKKRWQEVTTEEVDGRTVTKRRDRSSDGTAFLLPAALNIGGELAVEERKRGIYKATLYDTMLSLAGRFELPASFGLPAAEPGTFFDFGDAELVLGVSDPRGIVGRPTLSWNGVFAELAPGADAPGITSGITAKLGRLPSADTPQIIEFAAKLPLKGLQRIDFAPTGQESVVKITSKWPHPSFFGRYLPRYEAGEEGFSAEWRTSYFSTNINQLYAECSHRNCGVFDGIAHGVELFRPVDIYQQLERSTKYGFLFIGLTFLVFFLFEVLKRLPVHPVQYGLVGFALATFFLLLLSLAEHIAFGLAYAVASLASIALIAVYLSSVLRSLVRGAVLGAMLSGLYAMLYVLLQSEDQALLFGSVGIFAVLATVMLATRRVDWYALREAAPPSPPQETPA